MERKLGDLRRLGAHLVSKESLWAYIYMAVGATMCVAVFYLREKAYLVSVGITIVAVGVYCYLRARRHK